MYRRRRFARRPRRRVYRRGAKKSGVSTRIKKYVKNQIHRNIENKTIIQYGSNVACTSWGSATGWSLGLIPAIGWGTSENSRVGNQVRIVSGVMRGTVNLLPYDATTNPKAAPVLVKIFLYKYTQAMAQIAASPGEGQFFRGNSTGLPFQSNPIDLHLPINDALIKLYAVKTFRLGSTYSQSPSPISTGSYFDNSAMSRNFSFNWGKYVKKMLKFNDNSGSNLCQNDNIMVLIQPVYAYGVSSDGYQPAEVHYVNTVKFEDA